MAQEKNGVGELEAKAKTKTNEGGPVCRLHVHTEADLYTPPSHHETATASSREGLTRKVFESSPADGRAWRHLRRNDR